LLALLEQKKLVDMRRRVGGDCQTIGQAILREDYFGGVGF
jgi:hypothetical protein